MKNARLSDIVGIIGKIAPPALAESWDNPGLQLGNPTAEIKRIMVALDPLPAVVESACASNCQLLLTHHPLIFSPLKSISTATQQGKVIYEAIRSGLAIVSMHTNYDIVEKGLNDVLAARLGLIDCTPLQISSRQELVKLVVFVPEEHLEDLRTALFPFAEQLGRYRDCSFNAPGEGTFSPLEGARPFLGTVGARESVAERRLEVLVDRRNLPKTIKTLMSAHPYEEPAFDIYPLLNEGHVSGLGRIGRLPAPIRLDAFSAEVQRRLKATGLRYTGDAETMVETVALCSGSGTSVMRTAVRAGADVLVTGDVKYHDAREAEGMGIALIDAGHFGTEIIMVEAATEKLSALLAQGGYTACEVIPCNVEKDPFNYGHKER